MQKLIVACFCADAWPRWFAWLTRTRYAAALWVPVPVPLHCIGGSRQTRCTQTQAHTQTPNLPAHTKYLHENTSCNCRRYAIYSSAGLGQTVDDEYAATTLCTCAVCVCEWVSAFPLIASHRTTSYILRFTWFHVYTPAWCLHSSSMLCAACYVPVCFAFNIFFLRTIHEPESSELFAAPISFHFILYFRGVRAKWALVLPHPQAAHIHTIIVMKC